jgi:hypothetical protein
MTFKSSKLAQLVIANTRSWADTCAQALRLLDAGESEPTEECLRRHHMRAHRFRVRDLLGDRLPEIHHAAGLRSRHRVEYVAVPPRRLVGCDERGLRHKRASGAGQCAR